MTLDDIIPGTLAFAELRLTRVLCPCGKSLYCEYDRKQNAVVAWPCIDSGADHRCPVAGEQDD